jgi:hypothetical protein
MRLQNFLIHESQWSYWKGHLSLEKLFEIPQSHLSEELIKEVQRQYTAEANPTDFLTPLMTFMDMAEKEKAALEQYNTICSYLEKLHILRFFKHDQELYEQSKEKLQKLAYLKNIFLSWLADYKISQKFRRKADDVPSIAESELEQIMFKLC